MTYILLEEALENTLVLKGEHFKYVVKVRRHSVGDRIHFRSKINMDILYEYECVELENKKLILAQRAMQESKVCSDKHLHIGWCRIDGKSIEKVLPSLSELGVAKISFIMCERSQKNFALDMKRLERLQEASMQQSGRSSYIEFDNYTNIQAFIEAFPDTKVFDFTEKTLDSFENVTTVLIGCEGGFSNEERGLLQGQDSFRLKTPMVLRSESAVMAVASKVLV